MSIRTRTAIYLALTMLALTMVFVVFGAKRVDSSFNKLEQHDTAKSVGLVSNWLVSKAEPAQRNAQSWANWTPTFDFVTKGDKDYVQENLTETSFTSMDTDFMIFLDRKGEVVYAKFMRHGDARDEIVAAILESPGLTEFKEFLGGRRALSGSTYGPVALGLAPVVEDNPRSIGGTLVTGRFLDDTMMAAFTRETGLSAADVAWFSPRQPDLPADAATAADELRASGQSVLLEKPSGLPASGYGVVAGLMDRPAAIVKVTVDPIIMDIKDTLLRDTLIGLLIFSLVSIAALVLALDATILRRLSALTMGVRTIGEAHEKSGVRVPVAGRDEIAELATGVNGMLAAMDKQRDDLVALATVDALTNLYNRRRFVQELERELEKSKRLGESMALLWLDLDNFKRVNDTYGHTVGDKVLVAAADLLGLEMRSYCTLARLGGDEFVMMIPGADLEQGRLAAERLLDRFRTSPLEVDGQWIGIGVSIGVALYPESGETAEALLEAADNAMYDSKRAGRGRVTVVAPAVTTADAAPAVLDPEALRHAGSPPATP